MYNCIVGPSQTNYRCIAVPLHCRRRSWYVDRSNWSGSDIYPDCFKVHIIHGFCIVQRIDKEHGWGMNLTFGVETAPLIGTQSSIPPIIYICFKNLKVLNQYSARWIELNPTYKLNLFDDKLCEQFLSQEYSPLFSEIFRFIPDGPIKADFWRVCVIYRYGGIYADADIEPILPLSSWISPTDEFVTCLSAGHNNMSYNPHFIKAKRFDKFLHRCILEYLRYYTQKIPYTYWGWSIVGMFNRLIGFNENLEKKEGLMMIENVMCRFFQEEDEKDGRQFCTASGVKILSNRYKNYSNHDFQEKWFFFFSSVTTLVYVSRLFFYHPPPLLSSLISTGWLPDNSMKKIKVFFFVSSNNAACKPPPPIVKFW